MRRLAALALLLAAACGQGEPVVIPPEEIPFPLTRAEPTDPPGVREVSFSIALVRGRRLSMVEREATSSLPMPDVVVRTLLGGPTNSEADRGLASAIPSATRLLGVDIFQGVAEVDLSQEFQAAASSEGFLLRVAQVVTTLTALERVTAVRFSVEGTVTSVPVASGQIVQRPVTAADYAARLPRRR